MKQNDEAPAKVKPKEEARVKAKNTRRPQKKNTKRKPGPKPKKGAHQGCFKQVERKQKAEAKDKEDEHIKDTARIKAADKREAEERIKIMRL